MTEIFVVETLACYDLDIWFKPSKFFQNDFLHFYFLFFNVQTALRTRIHRIYDNKLFDEKHCCQTTASVLFTPYNLQLIICICLVMRTLTHTQNMKHTINTVVIQLIYVCSVFKSVKTSRSHDNQITNLLLQSLSTVGQTQNYKNIKLLIIVGISYEHHQILCQN